MSQEQSYIPFEVTAKVIARGEDSNTEFLQSLFPDRAISDDELNQFEHFVAGKIHDGIQYGLVIGSTDVDPIAPLEAYKMGFEHGKSEGEQ